MYCCLAPHSIWPRTRLWLQYVLKTSRVILNYGYERGINPIAVVLNMWFPRRTASASPAYLLKCDYLGPLSDLLGKKRKRKRESRGGVV